MSVLLLERAHRVRLSPIAPIALAGHGRDILALTAGEEVVP